MTVSLFWKMLFETKRRTWTQFLIDHCYAASPAVVARRFQELRSLTQPHFSALNLVLEEMTAASSKDLKLLLLTSCARFSIDGVASVAATCRICSDIFLLQGERKRLPNRNLREVELRECIAEDDWLKYFPQTLTSKVSFGLECYVSRCPSLKSLESLLGRAPQLTDLGTGSFLAKQKTEAFADCKQLESYLSGLSDILHEYLQALYSLWVSLTSYATVRMPDLVKILGPCPELQKLWLMDLKEDKGLEANVALTEKVLVSVSQGCLKLESFLQFTNAALVTIARNRPNIKCLCLCMIEPFSPDYKTYEQPVDEGFKAIAEECKDFQRLYVSDLGIYHLLSGCGSLRKVEIIRDCPFGASLLMLFGACKLLSQKMPKLNVKVIGEEDPPLLIDWMCLSLCGQYRRILRLRCRIWPYMYTKLILCCFSHILPCSLFPTDFTNMFRISAIEAFHSL